MSSRRSAEDSHPVTFFPIRHHSPACAFALERALDELKPRQVLVEAPVDFEPLVPLITDPATRPPVAILSLPLSEAGGIDGHTVLYPLCAQSPELVALLWAKRSGASHRLIDLPARHPQMLRRRPDQEYAPAPLIAEWRLDHNTYVAELCARRGVRDGLALWDALFESQSGTPDWRGFFDSVGLYCRHVRQVGEVTDLEVEGTLAREAHMAELLQRAVDAGPRPIAVVTGGFHTPALQEFHRRPVSAVTESAPAGRSYMIRHSFRQLDHAGGYGAGLPHPGFYDRVWRALQDGSLDGWSLPTGILTDFADHLRRAAPQLALATPTVVAAIALAHRLAQLRNLPFPGRSELIDAICSAGVKEALEAGRSPLLDAFHGFLTGSALGELPSGAAQPPIVERVRERALSLGFDLSDGARRLRELDILRSARHAEASRFLFALDLANAGFANRTEGPDPITGWRGEALFETWSYAWSPMVESHLIARSADGQTLEALCFAELARKRSGLVEQGHARSAAAYADLLIAAVRTGFETAIAEAMAEDSDAASIILALSIAAGLARPGPGAPDFAPRFVELRRRAVDRLLLLIPDLASTPPDRLSALIEALVTLATLVDEGDSVVHRERLAAATREALATALPSALLGALTAFAGLIGVMTMNEVASRIAVLFEGVYLKEGEAAAVLGGCLAVSPRLVVHGEGLLSVLDGFLSRMEDGTFIAALPELRLALSRLTPSEIDHVAAWVASRHGLDFNHLREEAVPAHEVAENIALSARMVSVWRDDGLADWLESSS